MHKNNYFEDGTCDLSTCSFIGRGYRDRNNSSSLASISSMYHGQKNNLNIIISQILDTAHNVLYHTFDMGLKIKMNDINNNNNNNDDNDEQEEEEKKSGKISGQCSLDELESFLLNENVKKEKVSSFIEWLKVNEIDSDSLFLDTKNDENNNKKEEKKEDENVSSNVNIFISNNYMFELIKGFAVKKIKFGLNKIKKITSIKNDENLDENDNDFSISLLAIKNTLNKRKRQFERIRNDKNNDINNDNNTKSFNKFIIDSSKSFSFGRRYFYHEYYRNLTTKKGHIIPGTKMNESVTAKSYNYRFCDWYITAKYASLLDEITNNKICRLSIEQFKTTLTKSRLKWKKLKNTKIISKGDYKWYKVYGIPKGSEITLDHVVSILLYTNYTKLCYYFSSTYRKLNINESDQDLKNRHSEFAIFGKILRETVESFGTYFKNSSLKRFYTGLSAPMNFDSFSYYICCPLSTAAS